MYKNFKLKNNTCTPLQSMLILFAAFALHRVFYFPFVVAMDQQSAFYLFKILLVGWASDLWVSFLLSLVLMLLKFLIKPRLNINISWLSPLIYFLIFFMIAAHQPYIEFFQVPMLPFHLNYMFDLNFLGANFSSISNPRFYILNILGLALNYWCHQTSFKISKPLLAVPLVAIAAISIHMFNIRYRIQWHVPHPMQTNFIESFYIQATQSTQAKPLSDQDISYLKENLLPKKDSNLDTEYKVWNKTTDSFKSKSKILEAYKSAFNHEMKKKTRPIIIIYLMESFRQIDIGKSLDGQPSLTANFDDLSSEGIAFQNAYSTGTTTRGAQEAVMCGYPGALLTSTMRNRSDINLSCLTKDTNAHTFWYHGGEGKFDNQVAFWQKQNVKDIISKKDFSESSPKTGWGVSDLSFVDLSINRLIQNQQNDESLFSLGMMLTVTNHIPWDLPEDFSHKQFPRSKTIHKSEKTVFHADLALGLLVKKLKEHDLWDKTLLIVSGDHGINAEPLNGSSATREEQLSHIALSLSGGMTKKVLTALNQNSITIKDYASQAGIAPFIAYLIDKKTGRYFYNSLFSENKKPILTDLGTRIYAPKTNTILSHQISLRSQLNSLEKQDLLPAYSYRSFRLDIQQM